jgi:iron complex transport system ATP-binding protein
MIEMHRVFVVKGRSKILKDVKLSIRTGERVVILGPNGSGKSSLIKVMLGEYRPDMSVPGSYVKIRGEEDFHLFDIRQAFGLVSPDLQVEFSRDMTVLEAVMSGFFGSMGTNRSQCLTPEMEDAALSSLAMVRSRHLAPRTMFTLSTGEARRVLMARALVNRPEALILDEPMVSLDLTGRHIVREALRSLANSGRALVLVTHDPSDIIPEIDRVVMMKDGRVIEDGGIEIITAENLSALYGVPIDLIRVDGRYIAWS